ncbi:integral membrane protein [Lactiplantibacillus plantarum]|nr:integral membrane protein [Lactiplantibacillus plantarum]MCG0599386.1 integral membrane protein [Lactiplantibacillus plantarum]MCG0602363.1 integral membrane protein [Lactiplantibacillus plantarum]MCG0605303.1 integral membrane protein [Lactiplantibacillus plantarum]MCG0742857.1 integral membrane protein [Lactiplantibacillus plantarum]
MNSFKNPLMTTPYLLAIIATLTMLVSPLTTVVISVLIMVVGNYAGVVTPPATMAPPLLRTRVFVHFFTRTMVFLPINPATDRNDSH